MAKKSNLTKNDVKNILYASIYELAKDKTNYYHSGFGSNYSHFTEKGEKAVVAFLQSWVNSVIEIEEDDLNKRAKDLVLKELKGENNKSV